MKLRIDRKPEDFGAPDAGSFRRWAERNVVDVFTLTWGYLLALPLLAMLASAAIPIYTFTARSSVCITIHGILITLLMIPFFGWGFTVFFDASRFRHYLCIAILFLTGGMGAHQAFTHGDDLLANMRLILPAR